MSTAWRRSRWVLPAILLAALLYLAVSETGLRWVAARFAPALTVEQLGGRLIGPIEARGLHWQGKPGAVDIGSLTLDWSPWRLLAGELQITRLVAEDLAVDWRGTGSAAGDGAVALPLALRIDDARLRRLVVRPDGGPGPVSLQDLDFAGRAEARRLDIGRLRVRFDPVELELRGALARAEPGFDGELHWTLRHAGNEWFAAGGRVHGDAERIVLHQTLRAPAAGTLQAELTALTTAAHARVRLAVEETALAAFDARLAGLRARGTLQAEGTLDRYALQLDATLTGTPLAPAHLAARARGDRGGLRLGAWRLDSPVGRLGGDGRIDWNARAGWQLGFTGRDLDPGKLWRDWPGRIAVDGSASGAFAPQPTLDLQLARVAGRLRGRALSGHAEFRLETRQRYALHAFALDLGGATLNASGWRRGREFELRWQAQADDLSALAPALAGTLASDGRAHGRWPQPNVAARVTAQRLRVGAYRAETLAARAEVHAGEVPASYASLEAGGVVLAGAPPLALQLVATGSPAQHRIRFDTMLAGEQLELALDGGLVADGWRGRVVAGQLRSARAGDWRLDNPAGVALGAHQARIERGCWRRDAGTLCLAGGWTAPRAFDARLEAAAVDAGLFGAGLPDGVTLSGPIDGQAEIRGGEPEALRVSADFQLGAGEWRHAPAGASATVIAHAGGRATLRADAERVRGQLSMALTDGGQAGIDFHLPAGVLGLGGTRAGPVSGRLALELRDLAPFGHLFPGVEQLRGAVHADLALFGTVRAPQLRGRLALEGGAAGVPALGIAVRDARLEIAGTDDEGLAVSGEMQSGAGRLRIAGRLAYGDEPSWSTELTVNGAELEAVRLPEAQVVLSPALRVQARPRRIAIDGELSVPQARLRPRDLTLAVTPSPDVVRVGPEPVPPAPPWEISSRVRLVLGDKVQLDGFDFSGWITGNVLAEDRPAQPATAVGELRVTAGHYKVYGRTLEVERGRLVFAGGPIDDPGLDLRAVRRVAGVVAGVQARGTLRRPQLTLVSEPAMSETDTLSYLLVGRPAEQASRRDAETLYQAASVLGFAGGELLARRIGATFGIEDVRIEQREQRGDTALMLGTYLTPRLYVSYGVGLFETLNILQIRYRLGRHWLLQTETGTASGADLLYTIER